MASLQEIKGRIASVQSTLKITSAMKMVASAKLHKTQNEALAFAGYSSRLSAMVSTLRSAVSEKVDSPLMELHSKKERAIIVAMASDMSLCGAFNHNAIKLLEKCAQNLRNSGYAHITVLPVGNKMAAAASKLGYESKVLSPEEIGRYIIDEYELGNADEVVLLYHHFLSVGSQKPVFETVLPFAFEQQGQEASSAEDYIFEPSAEALMLTVVPYCVKTKVKAAIFDNTISEHAARMVAMQTATDNAKDLLDELRLTYNKQRQQAITAELADIASNDA